MKLSQYSDKSFVITGNTKEHKESLKEMGGKWNSKLSCGPGWIFSLVKKKDVETWLQKQPLLTTCSDEETTTFNPISSSTPPQKNEVDIFEKFVLYLKPHYQKNEKLQEILCDFSHILREGKYEEMDYIFVMITLSCTITSILFSTKRKYLIGNINKLIKKNLLNML